MNRSNTNITKLIPWIGWVGFSLCIGLFCFTGCSTNTSMNEQANTYNKAKSTALKRAGNLTPDDTKQALDRFSTFLKGIGSTDFIKKETSNVYASEAYLNDTLKTLTNRQEIEDHFTKTAKTMTSYSLEIEDIAKSNQGHYIRWTMKFSAPKLAKGKEIITIGMSHVIFDEQGKVLIHQDFWDSTSGLFEHIPLLGGGINIVKKRL